MVIEISGDSVCFGTSHVSHVAHTEYWDTPTGYTYRSPLAAVCTIAQPN